MVGPSLGEEQLIFLLLDTFARYSTLLLLLNWNITFSIFVFPFNLDHAVFFKTLILQTAATQADLYYNNSICGALNFWNIQFTF